MMCCEAVNHWLDVLDLLEQDEGQVSTDASYNNRVSASPSGVHSHIDRYEHLRTETRVACASLKTAIAGLSQRLVPLNAGAKLPKNWTLSG
jgi:hypothetical protein